MSRGERSHKPDSCLLSEFPYVSGTLPSPPLGVQVLAPPGVLLPPPSFPAVSVVAVFSSFSQAAALRDRQASDANGRAAGAGEEFPQRGRPRVDAEVPR